MEEGSWQIGKTISGSQGWIIYEKASWDKSLICLEVLDQTGSEFGLILFADKSASPPFLKERWVRPTEKYPILKKAEHIPANLIMFAPNKDFLFESHPSKVIAITRIQVADERLFAGTTTCCAVKSWISNSWNKICLNIQDDHISVVINDVEGPQAYGQGFKGPFAIFVPGPSTIKFRNLRITTLKTDLIP